MLENDNLLDTGHHNGPRLPPEGAANLRKAGKWGRFIGLVSMVSVGLVVVMLFLFSGTFIGVLSMSQPGLDIAAWMLPLIIIYGLLFAVFLYLAYLLYNFGNKAMEAVDHGSAQAITTSFASLGRLLKILGIFTIIQLAFYALWMLMMVVGGTAAFLGS